MDYFVGVMSGTSLDGLDLAVVNFDRPVPKIIHAHTVSYPNALKLKLRQLIDKPFTDISHLGELDIELGEFIAQSIIELLKLAQLRPAEISAIGSHGHTLFHSPTGQYPFSYQIGNAHVIADRTGITTIADFRQRDMAAGGQGAPLVPAFHKALFASEQESRAVVNIGGIANITLLNSTLPVMGYDTGPGNTLLDNWIYQTLGLDYDEGGRWAASGECHHELLSALIADEYFSQTIPKSTGREYFNLNWLKPYLENLRESIPSVDIQATLLALTTDSIAMAIDNSQYQIEKVFICGGGTHNHALLSQLGMKLEAVTVESTEVLGLHPDWIEACAFAWFAQRHLKVELTDLCSVTGARYPVRLGICYPA